ncbi:HAAS signaling domain-containing protein [Streptodolium elevatio]|uniref:Uncharacterized protein n=1 Tax=Streptodolium elevatio TaxID=3157996 RepID=A0ABV3DT67_9ACTN
MTGAGELTDRYVAEVVRHISADQRGDVADELRATIADTVEARGADDPESAEREVLVELGDPIRLASRYTDRPLALVGPALYPTYIRILTLLLSAVLPVVVAVSAVLDVVDGRGTPDVIGGAVGTVLTVGAQLVAWLTVVFAVVERSGKRTAVAGATWTPDDLPDRHTPTEPGTPAYASMTWHALLAALIVWQHTAQPYRIEDGTHVDALEPGLWSGWIWPILAGLAALVTIDAVRAVRGATRSLAVWGIAAQAAFSLPLAWILYDEEFFNPVFLADFNGGWQTPDSFYTVTVLAVLAAGAGEVVKRLRELRG